MGDGELILSYDDLDVESNLFINGEYSLSFELEVSSLTNDQLLNALGTKSEFENKFNEAVSSDSDENNYTVLLGHQLFEINNSVSYKDLIENQKAKAKDIRFAELKKNPDKYFFEFVRYQGEILQIMEDETSTVIRLAVTKESYGYNFNDVVYITYTGTTPFVDEDIITVYGTIIGSHTYESQAGHQITLPHLEAEIIE